MAALVIFVVFFVAGWLGMPVAASAATTTVALKPASYTTLTGTDGGQRVTALHVRDQSGVQNDWDRYVEFTPEGGRHYDGYRRYFVPAHVSTAAITGLTIRTHFLGPDKTTQRWTWSVYNWRTRAWVVMGDNAAATSWSWTLLKFRAGGTLADYVRADTREIRVRLRSVDASDSADLDSEGVVLTVAEVAPATIWRPAPNTTWQWQLTALPVDTAVDVEMFDIDLFENSSAVVGALHAAGRKVVCYMSAGSWEDWRPDAAHFPAVVL